MTEMLLKWVLSSSVLIAVVMALRQAFGKRISARRRYAPAASGNGGPANPSHSLDASGDRKPGSRPARGRPGGPGRASVR